MTEVGIIIYRPKSTIPSVELPTDFIYFFAGVGEKFVKSVR